MDNYMILDEVPTDIMAKLPAPPSVLELRYNRLYIVEWLYDEDRKTGSDLRDFLREQRPAFDVRLRKGHSKDEVLAILTKIAEEVEDDQALPILQIEAHGDREGLGLYGPGQTNEEEALSFTTISQPLVRINGACKANLILFSAACWGANALKAAAEGPLPFMAVVGPTDKVHPKPLLEASKEFYRQACPPSGSPNALDVVVNAAALELGAPGDLAVSSMVTLTYQALVKAIWSKCDPEAIRSTALDMADKLRAPGDLFDLSQLPYSSALTTLHQEQGRAARTVWGERLLLDLHPNNWPRFDFDIEGMVRGILDHRYAGNPS